MSEMPTPADDLVVIGKIVSVYGIRGEVKVYSFTDPLDNLLDYRRWTPGATARFGRPSWSGAPAWQGPGRQAQGLDDREEARTFTGYEICIPRSELPSRGR